MKDKSYMTLIFFGVAAFVATPIIFIFYSIFTVDEQIWIRLYESRLKVILTNTIKLMLSVGILTTLFGVTSAYLVSRFDFKGKAVAEWLLILPLAVPGYVLAYCYASIMAPGGYFEKILFSVAGESFPKPSVYSFWGVSLILSLVNYPYVYLLTRAALLSQNRSYYEIATVLGVSKIKKFWYIELKMAYPAIFAGLALALMEVISDFGTVALLRYPTFTEAIYRHMTARFDSFGAAALSGVLLFLTLMLLILERYFRGSRQFEQTKSRFISFAPIKISWKGNILALLYVSTLVGVAFFAPALLLVKWSIKGLLSDFFGGRFLNFTLNTFFVSSIGATLAVVLSLIPSYLNARKPNFIHRSLFFISNLGYSVPGPVVAVGLLLTVMALAPSLYGGIGILVMAYVVRFVSIALQSTDSGFVIVSKSLEESAKTLGKNSFQITTKVLFPLIKPGVLTGWIVVFVDSMKELPATLLLRPLAFDTLAVRVWIEASEAMWHMAALPALLIVLAGLIPVVFVIRNTTLKIKRVDNYE